MNKTLIMVGVIIGLGGFIFSQLPHDVHMMLLGGTSDNMEMEGEMISMEGNTMQDEPMTNHSSHGSLVSTGYVIAIIGLGLAFAGWKIF